MSQQGAVLVGKRKGGGGAALGRREQASDGGSSGGSGASLPPSLRVSFKPAPQDDAASGTRSPEAGRAARALPEGWGGAGRGCGRRAHGAVGGWGRSRGAAGNGCPRRWRVGPGGWRREALPSRPGDRGRSSCGPCAANGR